VTILRPKALGHPINAGDRNVTLICNANHSHLNHDIHFSLIAQKSGTSSYFFEFWSASLNADRITDPDCKVQFVTKKHRLQLVAGVRGKRGKSDK